MAVPVQSRVPRKLARFFAAAREVPLLELSVSGCYRDLDVTSFSSPWLQTLNGYSGKLVMPHDPAAEPPQLVPDLGKTAWLWTSGIGLLGVLINSLSMELKIAGTERPAAEWYFPEFDIAFKRIERATLDWISNGAPLIIPDHLQHQLPQIVRFEDELALEPYHDWCLDNLWTERAEQLAKTLSFRYETAGDSRPRHWHFGRL